MKKRIFNTFIFFLLVIITAFEIGQVINQPGASDTVTPGWHTTIINPWYYLKYLALLILLIIFGVRAFKSNDK